MAEGLTPSLEPVFGAGADKNWRLASGTYAVGRENLEISGSAMSLTAGSGGVVLESRSGYRGEVQVSGLLRFSADTAAYTTADIEVARTVSQENGKNVNRALRMNIRASTENDTVLVSCWKDGNPLHDIATLEKRMDWTPQNANSFEYHVRAYRQFLPGWPEDFRTRVESDMATLPALAGKWIPFRIELHQGRVQCWIDDRMVAWKLLDTASTIGTVKLSLGAGVKLQSFTITRLGEEKSYTPVHIGGYLNGDAFFGGARVSPDSLPPVENQVLIEGVPFVFPAPRDGYNHVDVGRSLFRQGNLTGYYAAMYGTLPTWRGSTERDPARIQLRVPYAHYKALYLVAAAEDRPDTVPIVTASFYRPGAGFNESFETQVPVLTASSDLHARRLPVHLNDGKPANLWLVKIPLDPARLSAFADLDVVEIELTKRMELYRSYPDPICYGYHQAGLPSSVHIFAATLQQAPIDFEWNPDVFGHVWIAPAIPSYTAAIANHTGTPCQGSLTVTARSYDGTDSLRLRKTVDLPGTDAAVKIAFSLPVKLNGYYDVAATLSIAGEGWTERRSLVRLAPDTRSPRWTEGKGAMFGFWSYFGVHHTPHAHRIADLMTAAGARQSESPTPPLTENVQGQWARNQSTAYYVPVQEWAAEDNPDPAKVELFRQLILKNVENWERTVPDTMKPDNIQLFCESHISPRLTAGNYPEYFGDPSFEYTDEEKYRLKMFTNTAQIAANIIRKEFPDRKVLIEWGDPLFVVPLLRAGFPTNLVDGSGLDVPNFERLPEMQLKDNAVHRLYQLRQEYKKAGIDDPLLQSCEGIFVPTEPGAVSWREQMDIYNRWTLLDMAYGVTRFHSGWFAFDCANYYGAEHYGGCGIQRRIPFCDPKPAYAAFATLTDRLNEANFAGWLPTGSLTTYCLRFKGPRGNVYALWTVRGKRSVTLKLKSGAAVDVTDAMNNTKPFPVKSGRGTVEVSPSVIYVTSPEEITAVQTGEPNNNDAKPTANATQVANLGDGTWHYTSQRDSIYENNHWGFYPAAGKFTATFTNDGKFGKVLSSTLEKQDRERQLMPWYNTLRPQKPIALGGAPSHLGLWVKGNSDWGRIVYVLRDAHGERWISIGSKDDYNCDDIHSWNSFNFDGWRYLRFELPGHCGYDSFRKAGTTWWRSDAAKTEVMDGIVDLPLSLEEIIVEQRSHILYVNDVQPVPSHTVQFGKLFVEYASPEEASPEAVRISKIRMPAPASIPDLPNPIVQFAREGTGEPAVITALKEPEHQYDGTRMHIFFSVVPGAKTYYLWVSAHPDGRGAVDMVPGGVKSGDLVYGLRPGLKLYYWIVYTNAEGKMSRPAAPFEFVTVDNFKEK